MIIIIKQTLIGNIYKVTKERCGHAHITTVGVASFTKGCVLLWIFPLSEFCLRLLLAPPLSYFCSRSYSYFFCFNGINKQQFSSVLTLKWKFTAHSFVFPLFSRIHSHKFHTTSVYFAISLRISFNFTPSTTTTTSSVSSSLFF